MTQRQALERAHEHISRDVEALRTLSDELDEQRELLEVTLHSITDAVITTDATGAVTWLNPVAERLTGHDSADSLGRPLAEIFRAVDAQTGRIELDPVAACLDGREAATGTGHAILVSRADERLDIEHSAAPIRKRDAHPLGVVLVFRDVSEQRRLAAEMNHRATHDALTGLINPRGVRGASGVRPDRSARRPERQRAHVRRPGQFQDRQRFVRPCHR